MWWGQGKPQKPKDNLGVNCQCCISDDNSLYDMVPGSYGIDGEMNEGGALTSDTCGFFRPQT